MKDPRIVTSHFSTFLKLGLAAAHLAILGACSPAAAPVSRSSNDPSSPTAPAGASPLVATATSEHHAHDPAADHDHTGADGVVYVCPMHPEVTSTKAGELCPKCNMKLVPKK